jgi:hypothetical protein
MPDRLVRARRAARGVRVCKLDEIREEEAARAGLMRGRGGWIDASGVGLPLLDTAREAAMRRFSGRGASDWVAIIEMTAFREGCNGQHP